jgi:hypothetical protein
VTLRALGWDYRDALQPLPAIEPQVHGNRVEYRYGALTEWYVNRAAGLEHGFTLLQPPAGDMQSELVVELALSGGEATLTADGQALVVRQGASELRYAGLRAWDATGRALPARMTLAGARVALWVDAHDARYPLTIDPTWTEQQKLTALDAAAGEGFGWSVAISGDTAVIGAPEDGDAGDASGAAYVFVRSGGVWSQQQKLTAADGAAFVRFGRSVAVSGDTAVVGAAGAGPTGGNSAYVFVRNGTTWSQQQKLTASDGAALDGFGSSVAVAGEMAMVGALLNDAAGQDSGAAYVFVRNGSTWTEQQKLTASNGTAGDQFGWSVAVSGETAVIGARGDGGFSGAAYVFVRNGSTWTEQQKLTAADGAIFNEFGSSVAISGETAVIGADDELGSNSGAAYVFVRGGTTWSEQAKLTASDGIASDLFGTSVAISGDTVMVGASNAGSVGAAYVFVRSGSVWTEQQKLTAADAAFSDLFGWSVAMSGDTVVVGAISGDSAVDNTGAAYVFVRGADALTPQLTDQLEADQEDAAQGATVTRAGDINGDGFDDLLVTAPQFDNGQTNEGIVQVFLGSPQGLRTDASGRLRAAPNAQLEANQDNANFGSSAAGAADFDNNGFDDVAIGASNFDNGQDNEGAVFVYSGSDSGLNPTPIVLESNQANASFGASTAAAGDINDDGFDDLLVGAPGFSNGQAQEGAVYVYLGSDQGLSTSPTVVLEGN